MSSNQSAQQQHAAELAALRDAKRAAKDQHQRAEWGSLQTFFVRGVDESEESFILRTSAANERYDAWAQAGADTGDAFQYLSVDLPPAFDFLFRPAPYKVAHGGRGSGKSHSFAKALVLAVQQHEQKALHLPREQWPRPMRVLCTREQQNSIKDSVHFLLSEQIEQMHFRQWFKVTDESITGRHLGSEFIFKGLRTNVHTLKSTEAVSLCWVEEAEKVSQNSWEKLLPTLFRVPDCELWVSFNPDEEKDPTYQKFVKDEPLPGAVVRAVSWRDNPWFPPDLAAQRDHMARVDPDAYQHVWEGQCRTTGDAQVFRGKYVVEWFEPPADLPDEPTEAQKAERARWDGPYYGIDWGFAVDPTTMVRLWIRDKRDLMIEQEAYAVKCDLGEPTAALFARVTDSKRHIARADNSRPESISFMQQNGYPNIRAVEKWPGSVEDGIAIIRQFDHVVIHPKCTHAIEESRLYSYKLDRLTSDILPEVVDKHNHIWDAVRYALEPIIKQAGMGIFNFMKQKAEEAQCHSS